MICNATPEMVAYVAARLGENEVGVREYGFESMQWDCLGTVAEAQFRFCIMTKQGEPVSLIGATASELEQFAWVWMFSTDKARAEAVALVRDARKAIAFAKQHWPELRICPEERDASQNRYLGLLGFIAREDGVLIV